ncbi:hypothetical protein [Reyranella sp.]|uniref:hypothetical protein n=1 Tax=Reyranella sp. TaxID=1929291 RepID=UPI00378367FE
MRGATQGLIPGLRTYSVNPRARAPLVDYMVSGLTKAGCKIIHSSSSDRAPFVVAFETASRERMGIVAYAFLATRTPTRNRPQDERSFQIKYGSKESYAEKNSHELWQDPLGMFTTMLVGIDPEHAICVSADPIAHSPTKFFIRLEFKDEHAEAIAKKGWHAWERIRRSTPADAPRVETLVGADKSRFLDLVRFERAARGLEPGNRLILAEEHAFSLPTSRATQESESPTVMRMAATHPLVRQFGLRTSEILDLIAGARRLKMAVRGWVAEEHLQRSLSKVPGVSHCERLDEEGGPDIRLRYRQGPVLTVECKNVARERDRNGNPRLDFQRTRAAKGNPCSRYYEPTEFDVVAACLHAVSSEWDFRFALPGDLSPHNICVGRIASNVRIDDRWREDAGMAFQRAYAAKGLTL